MSGAVMIMPRPSSAWAGAAALWITAAGWAGAARRRWGRAWVVTPDAVADPDEVLEWTRSGPASPAARAGWRSRVPTPVVTLAKDARRARAARRFPDLPAGPWDDGVELVWQHHDLFARTGAHAARRLGSPLVTYVHAPQVWEAARWGTTRPGWGRIVERWGEAPQLRAADVVACVTDEVARELPRFGVDPERIVVSPMAADADRFHPGIDAAPLRRELGIDPDDVVIGWTGSFRRFHGLDLLLDAFAGVAAEHPRARLLLVGDGPERSVIEQRAAALGVGERVITPGAAAHPDVPTRVACMDVTVVVARDGETFHYSPLKLREYLAAGRPAVVPRAGEPGREFGDADGVSHYEPGDPESLASALVGLVADAAARRVAGERARRRALVDGTWDIQLERVVASSAFRAARERTG